MFNFPTLTVDEVSKEFGISKGLVYKAIKGQLPGPKLPSIRWGRKVLIRPESLVQWLRDKETENGNEIPKRVSRKVA